MPLVPEFLAGRTPPDLYHDYLEPAFHPWADALVKKLGPEGDIIDIACGTGLVARTAASCAGVRSIEAIDVAPPMIAKARSLAEESQANIRYSVASALDLPFEDASFDAALCQQGLQFFPDKLAGLREANRVLKPGATAAFSTWCFARDGNPVFAAFEAIVSDLLGSDLVPFGPLAFGDRDRISQLAGDADFAAHSVDTLSLMSPLPDPRTLVLFDLAFLGRPASDGTLQPILDFEDPASDEMIEKLIELMREATMDFRQEDGSLLAPMRANILFATA